MIRIIALFVSTESQTPPPVPPLVTEPCISQNLCPVFSSSCAMIYKLVGGHQTPVHLHDEVHDGESKREKGEDGEWVSTATSPSKLS